MKNFRHRALAFATACVALACYPYYPDEVQAPSTFAADLTSVEITREADHITVTSLNESGVVIGELAMIDDGQGWMWLSSDYSDGRFVVVIDREDDKAEPWVWPTTLPMDELVHRAKLIEDMIGADGAGDDDQCGIDTASAIMRVSARS